MRRFLLAALAGLGLVAPALAASLAPRIPSSRICSIRAIAWPAPGIASVKSIRFLTTDDFPPFHFALADGSLAGFDIDLARAICSDLKLACTIQARRFDTVLPQIEQGRDDAAIAAIADTPATRNAVAFTAPYYTTPARFVAAGRPTPRPRRRRRRSPARRSASSPARRTRPTSKAFFPRRS